MGCLLSPVNSMLSCVWMGFRLEPWHEGRQMVDRSCPTVLIHIASLEWANFPWKSSPLNQCKFSFQGKQHCWGTQPLPGMHVVFTKWEKKINISMGLLWHSSKYTTWFLAHNSSGCRIQRSFFIFLLLLSSSLYYSLSVWDFPLALRVSFFLGYSHFFTLLFSLGLVAVPTVAKWHTSYSCHKTVP